MWLCHGSETMAICALPRCDKATAGASVGGGGTAQHNSDQVTPLSSTMICTRAAQSSIPAKSAPMTAIATQQTAHKRVCHIAVFTHKNNNLALCVMITVAIKTVLWVMGLALW